MKYMNVLHKLNPDKRPIRVLHIGNLANNAYYNAKYLRCVGVKADVLCYDNYWVMSSPEWEEVDLDDLPEDQNFPNWWSLELKGYQRPRWFAQGPFETSVKYLMAKQSGQLQKADLLWEQMEAERRQICDPTYTCTAQRDTTGDRLSDRKQSRFIAFPMHFITKIKRLLRLVSRKLHNDAILLKPNINPAEETLLSDFARRFPNLSDRLIQQDLLPFQDRAQYIAPLLKQYDIIQGYAIDPLYPMLANFHPYVAFEHGTLRDAPEASWDFKVPFYNNALGRITALSYAMADHVFITNADCLSSAQRLGLTHYEAIPHPVTEENDFFPNDRYRDEIRAEVVAQIVLFCPIRHNWADKGVGRYIRILPQLRTRLGDSFKLCFTPWGQEIERSKELISALGCQDLVRWVGPFGKVRFAHWMASADVVLDQVMYPSFSGITPRALACGTPVIAYYEQKANSWMFDEPAPVLTAQSEAEILTNIDKAITPGFREQYCQTARAWFLKHHSSERVTKQLLTVYQSLLAEN